MQRAFIRCEHRSGFRSLLNLQYLTQTDFLDVDAAIDNCREQGFLTDKQFVEIVQAVDEANDETEEVSADRAIPASSNATLAGPQSTVASGTLPTPVQPTVASGTLPAPVQPTVASGTSSAPVQPTVASGSSSAPVQAAPNDALAGPTTDIAGATTTKKAGKGKIAAAKKGKGKAREKANKKTVEESDLQEEDFEEVDPAELLSSALALYENVQTVLYDSPDATFRERFEACLTIPLDQRLAFAYRDGHVPIDDRCPFCTDGSIITEHFKIPTTTGKRYRKDLLHAYRRHIYEHAQSTMLEQMLDVLLKRYTPRVPFNPLTGVRAPGGISIHQLAKQIRSKANHEPVDGSRFATCATCPDHPILRSTSCAREHLLIKHGIWCGPGSLVDRNPEIEKLPWSQEYARFPDPVYYLADASYHADPLELVTFCEKLYEQRFVAPVSDRSEPFGCRKDLEYPRDDLSLAFDLSQKGTSDQRYLRLNGKCSSAVQEGFCIFCANDPSLGWADRMLPDNTDMSWKHFSGCVATHARGIRVAQACCAKGYVPPKSTPWYVDANGELSCPDPHCNKAGRPKMKTSLDLVNHLVACHHVRPRGRDPRYSGRSVKLSELSFANQGDLDAFQTSSRLRSLDSDLKQAKKLTEKLAKAKLVKKGKRKSTGVKGGKGKAKAKECDDDDEEEEEEEEKEEEDEAVESEDEENSTL